MHLSSGRSEVRCGLEKYTFKVSMSGILAVTARAEGSKRVMNQALVGWYLLSPRPDGRDILSATIHPIEDSLAEVTLIIKRGHYTLLDLLHQHEDITISAEGTVTCSCHVGIIYYLIRSTLPDYGAFARDGDSNHDG